MNKFELHEKRANDFKIKAVEKYKNLYDYSEVEYINSNTKVKIICNRCGKSFLQSPSSHLFGKGCKDCNLKQRDLNHRLTTDEFIRKSKLSHGDKYDYSKVEYVTNRTAVTIICPIHGEFLQVPSDHMSGCGCKECGIDVHRISATKYLDKFKNTHGDKYDYGNSKINGYNEKICIKCNTCGNEFWQKPSEHARGYGCLDCGRVLRRLSSDKFVNRATQMHGDKYDYSKLDYQGVNKKVNIVCKECGNLFKQKGSHHLKGNGCPKCNNWNVYNKKEWVKRGKVSNYFDGYKLYILNIYNNEESFIKIGITFRKINVRFHSNSANFGESIMPYNYKEIKVVESEDGEYICNLENQLHKELKQYSYVPNKKFAGMYECFSIDCLDIVKEKLKIERED